MAEPGSEAPSPMQTGAGYKRLVETGRTPEGKLYPGASTPPPPIPDHELLCLIGRGSYGEVWLGRNVLGEYRAVKIIDRLHFDSDHAYEREFEGLKRYEPISRGDSSQVAVLQVGRNETAGFYYYVMELADDANAERGSAAPAPARAGRAEDTRVYRPHTLRHEMQTRGRLQLEDCVRIGLALTTALDYLHRHGLIHRDIKPSNVVFLKGVPKLADIGLVARIDATMSFVGTEGYIPPEGPGTPQADLYSLGKVLYEMSSGKDRSAFPEPLTLLAQEPEKARFLELNAVIHQACHRDPNQRYGSALEMQADLKRLERGESVRRRQVVRRRWAMGRKLALASLLMAATTLSAYSLYRTLAGPPEMVAASKEHPMPVPLKASVFVLPFRSVSTNEVDADLCSRVTDALIDSLALVEGVQRSPRKSGWRWLDQDGVQQQLAKTNAMHHVLRGGIGLSNDTLTLELRLYKGTGNRPVWTQSICGKTNELIAVETRALRELATRLGLIITASEQQRVATLLTNNLEALRWYQQAQAVYTRKAGTQIGYTEVRKLAQRAMDLDRRYLDADYYDAYMLRNLAQDRAPSDVWRDVEGRMRSLLAQDDTYAGAFDHLAGYTIFYERDWESAYPLWNFDLLYRSKQESLWLRAFWYRIHGWFDEARICQQESEHPEPTGDDQRFFMAASRWSERRYAEGVAIARRTLELYPGHAEGYQWLAHCLVGHGDYAEGIEVTHKAQQIWNKQEMTALRAVAYAKLGQTEKAREVLGQLLEMQRSGPYLQFYFVARVRSALNQKEQALEWLEKAEQDSSEYLVLCDLGGGLQTDPVWDDFKEEPRFKVLLKKVGLDQWPRPKPKLPLAH